ncbi:hypothetical protein FQN54_002842 [Arachnomyces sp. PD_36]|nr:hypothetical protein FQN54_002842 [Arachnomyces sp. PD_36]
MSSWLDFWASFRRRCLICRICSKRWRKSGVTTRRAGIPPERDSNTQKGVAKKTPSYSSDSSTTVNYPTQQALTVTAKGVYRLEDDYPIPELEGDREIMIRNYAVGLNPVDWKTVEYGFCLPELPWITGREMAGVVEKVSPGVTRFRPGDRVWTSTYYRDKRAGCFQEFVTVLEHTVVPIPANLSFESAACLGVGALTAAMTLWKTLDVPVSPPPQKDPIEGEHREYILIWGGSTVTGQFAIQLCIRGGLNVIAVTSEKTKYLVQSLGATHVITRDSKSDEDVLDEIRGLVGDKITRGIDLVGPETSTLCLKALSKSSTSLFAPLAMMSSSQDIPESVQIQTVEMKRFVLDESCRRWAIELNGLVESGELRLPQVEVLKGGLKRVEEGLKRVKRGDMEGKKIVVSMSAF